MKTGAWKIGNKRLGDDIVERDTNVSCDSLNKMLIDDWL